MTEGRIKAVGGYITGQLGAAVKLTKDQLVLSRNNSGNLILATNTTVPYAIASRSTQNKVARVAGIVSFDVGAKVAPIPMFRSGFAELQLGSTNIAIAIGTRIVVHADDDGTVNGAAAESTVAHKYLTVGYAEETVALNAGGTVKTALCLPYGGAP